MPESKTDRYQRAEEIAQQIIDENFTLYTRSITHFNNII